MPYSLRNGLDRDVYQVVKKLEEANGKPFANIYTAYEAIKRSNSSLSRQKKKPLEDSLDRVMQVRKQEQTGDDESEADSEAALDEAEQGKSQEDRFLLNRQMTKLWGVDSASTSASEQPAKKKRRVETEDEDRDAPRAESVPNGTSEKSAPASTKGDKEKEKDKDKDKTATKKQPRPTRYDVETEIQSIPLGGLTETYNQLLRQAGYLLKLPELYPEYKLRRTSGILISGQPGTGKKSLIKKLAAAVRVPLITLTACFEDPERMEKSLNDAFDAAMSMAPCIILIEKLDRHMGKGSGSANSENQQRAISQFERQMLRLQKQSDPIAPVLAMATTSKPTDVDPEVLRRGLFERTIAIRIPDAEARKNILKVHTADVDVRTDLDFDELAKMTHGFVGADIANVVDLASQVSLDRLTDMPDIEQQLQLSHHTSELNALDDFDLAEAFESLDPPPEWDHSLSTDDFKQALKGFVPSLRREGFTVIPNVTWDQVGALQKVRRQLNTSIIGPIKNPDLYRKYGLQRPAGALLWGPPGCGKTLVAQAVANEAQASFILINGPELLNKYLGESERAVRELFQRARSSTPCILFFDEMDSLVPRRDNASTEAGARVVNALLTELDGAQDRSGIYVIGTTNRPDMIDAAMLRPGRLSVRLFVDLPTPEERVDILTAIYKTCHEDPTPKELECLPGIARDPRCEDFSGADLGGLHTKAAEVALERFMDGETTAQGIETRDWEKALCSTRRSVLNPDMYRKLNTKLGEAN